MLAAALACSSASATGDAIDRSTFTDNACTNGIYAPLRDVTFNELQIYVALVMEQSGVGASAPRAVIASNGVPCTLAADETVCLALVKSAASQASVWTRERCGGAGCTKDSFYFVVESKGAVRVVDTNAGLAVLVGPVESAHDAALLAVYGQDLDGMDCSAPQLRPLADGTFDVFLGHGDRACTDRVERVVHVAKDGSTTVVASSTRAAEKTCVAP
ncbi:hypothetical protein BH09MYX1_BH09MYX1_16180 [soil metagenome]